MDAVEVTLQDLQIAQGEVVRLEAQLRMEKIIRKIHTNNLTAFRVGTDGEDYCVECLHLETQRWGLFTSPLAEDDATAHVHECEAALALFRQRVAVNLKPENVKGKNPQPTEEVRVSAIPAGFETNSVDWGGKKVTLEVGFAGPGMIIAANDGSRLAFYQNNQKIREWDQDGKLTFDSTQEQAPPATPEERPA